MAKTLPPDIIAFEILPRLPAKSLIRCKAVCKCWKTLISSPNFITSHLLSSNTNNNNNLLIFSGHDSCLHSFDFEFPESSAAKLPLPLGSRVAGSCNGLLCLLKIGDKPTKVAHLENDARPAFYLVDENVGFRMQILLLNPSTRALKVIPQAPMPSQFNLVQVIIGFGYDRVSDDYKIVRILQCGMSVGNQMYHFFWFTVVFSLRANSWKFVEDNDPSYRRVDKSAVLDGHLIHWLRFVFHDMDPCNDWIDCFDVCDDKWSKISLPESRCGFDRRVVSLGVIQKCLCLLNGDFEVGDRGVEVWVLKEYGVTESWVKLFDVVGASPHDGVVGCRDGGNEILLWRGCRRRLFWYNIVNQTTNDFEVPGVLDIYRVHMCKGTLVGVVGDQVAMEKKESVFLKISQHVRQFFRQHPLLR